MLHSGFARAEITPGVPIRMGGYAARQGPATGVHDPLFVRVLALQDGEREGVLAVLDLLSLDRKTSERLCEEIARSAGIRPDALTLACTHTHSGPQPPTPRASPSDEEYLETLAANIAKAVSQARARRRPGPVKHARGRVEGIAADRRLQDKATSAGELDVLLIGDTLLVCFACHPTVLGSGNREISADFPGATVSYAERRLGLNCMFVQGAAGNLSTRLTRQKQDFDEVERLGEKLGCAVEDLVARAREVPPDGLDAASDTLALTLRDLPSPEQAREKVAARKRHLARMSRSDAAKLRASQTALEGALIEEALVECAATMGDLCPISAVRVGGAAFVTVPGELFSDLGDRIRERSPFYPTCIIGYAGGYVGYLPGAAGYDPESYESSATPFVPEAGDLVAEEALRLLNMLKSRKEDE